MLRFGHIYAFLGTAFFPSSMRMNNLARELYVLLQYGHVSRFLVFLECDMGDPCFGVGAETSPMARCVCIVQICIPILLFADCILLSLHLPILRASFVGLVSPVSFLSSWNGGPGWHDLSTSFVVCHLHCRFVVRLLIPVGDVSVPLRFLLPLCSSIVFGFSVAGVCSFCCCFFAVS